MPVAGFEHGYTGTIRTGSHLIQAQCQETLLSSILALP